MQSVELAILDGIQHLRCGLLDTLLPLITHTADHGEIWILLAVVLLILKRKRQSGLAVSGALVLDVVSCNLLIKPLVGRVRPFAVSPTAPALLVEPPIDASFPSGHTAASFAAVAALYFMGDPLWKPALGLALVIAFSRLYLYVHWPSDVLGGVILGIAVGWAGAYLVHQLQKRKAEHPKKADS